MLPLAALLLSAPALGAQARGSIVGVVRDSADGLIAGAEVTVVGLNARAATDGSGVFRLDGIPAAVTQLQIRRLGYAPASVDVQVAGGQQARVEVRLAVLPYALAPVSVRERREVFDSRLAGFHSRRQKGVGHFFTREHLDRLSFRLADVLREVPGVRISPLRGAGRTVRLRGNCPALIVIDGTPATVGVFDIDMIDLASIEAVEVYSSASSVPAELMTARGLDRCGVVALWSRPSRSRRASSSGAPGAEVRAMLAAGKVYAADAVDLRAELIGPTLVPVYPESLWREEVGGRVLLEFVVDERGDVELSTVTAVASTHAAFTEAVRAALAETRFRPAILGGRAVKQAVQLPVLFEIPQGNDSAGLAH